MDMSKKDGGVIVDWTLNVLSYTPEELANIGVEVRTDKVYILSGYVKEDPTGRFQPGWHFRSSPVVEIDAENGIVETRNTIYRIEGEANSENALPDMGNMIMKVFY